MAKKTKTARKVTAARSPTKPTEIAVLLGGGAPNLCLTSGALLDLHRAHGTRFHLGRRVVGLHGAGTVEAVELDDGTRLPVDVVVVGIGVRPADEWLHGSGLTLGNGVVVDEHCETSVPGIFAAGDVASWPYLPTGARVRVEHFDNALRQGEAAARNMLGDRTPAQESNNITVSAPASTCAAR